MMIRSRTPSCSAGGMPGRAGSVSTAGPGVGWEFVTGGTTPMVRAAFPRARSARGVDDDLGQVALEAALAGHQPGDPHQEEPALGGLVEGQVGRAVHGAGGPDRVAVQVAVRVLTGADLDLDARRARGQGDPGDVL